MKRVVAILISVLLGGSSALADPIVKVINFTADWCPNCQILNPALYNALTRFEDGEVELVNLDMTNAGRRASESEAAQAWSDAMNLAHSHQAFYLWDWYGGVTGIAAIISADNGEPIACVNRTFDESAIEGRIREAIILSERRIPGSRKPDGPECPPPMRQR
ncbi:MAG: thioredoxin domain-containing protein [Pseudomonadota bacterium]